MQIEVERPSRHTAVLAPGPELGSAGSVGPWAEVWVTDPHGQTAAGLVCLPLPGTTSSQRGSQQAIAAHGG